MQDPVLFYIIDGETGEPRPFAESERPTLFGQNLSPSTAEPLTERPSPEESSSNGPSSRKSPNKRPLPTLPLPVRERQDQRPGLRPLKKKRNNRCNKNNI